MAKVEISHSGPVVSLDEARNGGLARYFTGKPCKRGHVGERVTTTSRCVECARNDRLTYITAWQKDNPDKVAEYRRRSRERHREKILERGREHMRDWRAAHPEESRRRVQEYRRKYPERVKEQAQRRHENNPHYRKRYREANREKYIKYGRERYKRKRPELVRYANERRKRQQEEMAGRPRAAQCEVCGGTKRIAFDHCHASGKFRGWLCGPCNSALGLVRDNPETLRRLAVYLEQHNGQRNGVQIGLGGDRQEPQDQEPRGGAGGGNPQGLPTGQESQSEPQESPVTA